MASEHSGEVWQPDERLKAALARSVRQSAIAAAKERAVAAAVALKPFLTTDWSRLTSDEIWARNAAWLTVQNEFIAAVDALAALTEGSDDSLPPAP